MTRLSTSEAKDNFSDLVSRVAVGKERIVLTQAGEELVAVIPVEDLALMEAALEDRQDLEDARAARREAEEKGTISLKALREELGL